MVREHGTKNRASNRARDMVKSTSCSGEARVFPASRIAIWRGVTPRAIHQGMRGVPPDGSCVVRGQLTAA